LRMVAPAWPNRARQWAQVWASGSASFFFGEAAIWEAMVLGEL
jgi:hypothetical protein